MSLDIQAVRREFPLLGREVAGKRIAYLDAASTAPRLRCVLGAMQRYQTGFTANVHRGVHALAAEASEAFENARHVVAAHVGATPAEIVFTSGTTDAANLVADALAFADGDEVLTTLVEHHSNLLPWRRHARTRLLASLEDGRPDFASLPEHIDQHTRVIAVHHASNVLGSIAPIAEIARIAHARGALLFVDGAQAAGHMAVDVRELECDFYAFSGHKLGGPSGTGALFVRAAVLEQLATTRVGGGMVAYVGADACEWKSGAQRFEAGTPNIEGVLGLAAAIEYMRALGVESIEAHERALASQLVDACARLPGVRVLGPRAASERVPLVALGLPPHGLDAETIARTLSDSFGVLVSAGRHCTHPLHDSLGLASSLRASAWIHNDADDVDRFTAALRGLVC
jgi:cysteine desulfurase/selenocysteine lyase